MAFFSRRGGDVPPAPLPYDDGSPEAMAARWTRWVAGAGPMHNPLLDTTGDDAGVGQPEDVWFLGGTFGGPVTRSCTVPSGVPLFFPAFNMWFTNTPTLPDDLPDGFGRAAVDGVDVPLETIATPVAFEVSGARLNPVTRTSKPVPMTVWGLWATIPPLAAGSHVVRLGGGDGHGFTVDATYQLEVAP
jgi:hypothetical protein